MKDHWYVSNDLADRYVKFYCSQIDDLAEASKRASEAEKLQEDYWKPSSIVERMVSEILTKGKTELGEVELYIGAILTYLDEQYEEQKERNVG